MIDLEATLYLKSQKSLEEVAEILSKELFGGLLFGGKEDYIRDEIPAIYIEGGILGLSIILQGGDIDDVCILNMYPFHHSDNNYGVETKNSSIMDLTEYLGFLLRNTKEVVIMTSEEVELFESQFS